MKKLALSLFSLIIFTACETTFQLEFTNGSSDTYELYINDEYQQDVEGKKKVTYTIPEGYWSAKVVQKTGYIFYPTIKEYSGTCDAGESYYIVFP
jgi:hypothetical protein